MKPGLPGLRRVCREQRGVTAIEFALVAPVFIVIVIGIFDFGLGIWSYNTLSEAVREGARYAIVRGDGAVDMNDVPIEAGPLVTAAPESYSDCTSVPAGSVSAVVCQRAVPLDPAKLSVVVSWENNHTEEGNALDTVVTVSGHYVYTPFLGNFFPFTINLRSTSAMPIMCCNRAG